MKFEKTITVTKEKIIIEVKCKKQVYSSDERKIFKEDVFNLIPEEYNGKIELLKEPSKLISNIPRKKYTNHGVWEFKILKQEKKTTRRTRTRKKQTENENGKRD